MAHGYGCSTRLRAIDGSAESVFVFSGYNVYPKRDPSSVRSKSSSFDDSWRSARRYRQITPDLETLIAGVDRAVRKEPLDSDQCFRALEALLVFLSSSAGRTDANCTVTDQFFATYGEDILSRLPVALRTIISDMGGTLHDAIYAPAIAANFESLPEQLLARLRAARGIG